jgi:hypothetical protein
LGFLNSSNPTSGAGSVWLATGDFNGDGKPDFVVANGGANTVTILLGNGDGTFSASAVSPVTGIGPQAVAVGDFNGDGKADIAVANTGAADALGTVTIRLGRGRNIYRGASQPIGGQ